MLFNFFKTADAHIRGGKEYPQIDGIVSFKETKDGVLLTAKVTGLPQSYGPCKRKIFWLSYS